MPDSSRADRPALFGALIVLLIGDMQPSFKVFQIGRFH